MPLVKTIGYKDIGAGELDTSVKEAGMSGLYEFDYDQVKLIVEAIERRRLLERQQKEYDCGQLNACIYECTNKLSFLIFCS